MKHLVRLFRLLEITRSQVQYGYALADISKAELSDLAQHHYLVTIFAWHLARQAVQAGAQISVEKTLEYGLIHDLGELFGGDISMSYARANPAAKKAAKKFEAANQKYLATLFGSDKEHFQKLSDEIMDATSDEALIAKIADYLEITQYKLYVGKLTVGDITMAIEQANAKIVKMHDPIAKKVMQKAIKQWANDLRNKKHEELFETAKTS